MEDMIILTAVVLLIGAACTYIRRRKKQGSKCIGCPAGNTCCGNCGYK